MVVTSIDGSKDSKKQEKGKSFLSPKAEYKFKVMERILTLIVGIIVVGIGLYLAWSGFNPPSNPTNFFQGIFGIQLAGIGLAIAKGEMYENKRRLGWNV